ncbi:MAG: ATP synthase F1 subunit gamma, partial [Bacteroidota bacterium]
MPSLKEVRNRISTVKSTQQITKAMKMVAAAKLRRAQERIFQLRPYADRLQAILQNITASIADAEFNSVYAEQREIQNVLIVAITSDRGLCGAFNNNIFKASLRLAQDKYPEQFSKGQVEFLAIGKKGFESLSKNGYQTVGDYVEIIQKLTFNQVKEAGDYLLERFKNKEVDRVELVFNEFKNVVTQIVRTNEFLPISYESPEDNQKSANTDYLMEPSKEEIIEELIPKSLITQLFRAVLESNASEHGARMTAMDNATENANELLKELKLTYNQTRQAYITKEILEIV